MSGGHFDHSEISLCVIADEMETVLEENKNVDGYDLPANITEMISKTIGEARVLQRKIKAIDYLLSGDNGENSFMKEWSEIESSG